MPLRSWPAFFVYFCNLLLSKKRSRSRIIMFISSWEMIDLALFQLRFSWLANNHDCFNNSMQLKIVIDHVKSNLITFVEVLSFWSYDLILFVFVNMRVYLIIVSTIQLNKISFFSERLNHVEPRDMVESKRINISKDRLLNPWIHSPLSKYRSSLMHHV
jgi:hypothetical protein